MLKPVHFVIIIGLMLGADQVKAKKDKKGDGLPPGLQMNQERGKSLPPGWEKKLAPGEILDPAVYDHGEITIPLDDKGFITLEVEGKLLRLIGATHEIVEILK